MNNVALDGANTNTNPIINEKKMFTIHSKIIKATLITNKMYTITSNYPVNIPN